MNWWRRRRCSGCIRRLRGFVAQPAAPRSPQAPAANPRFLALDCQSSGRMALALSLSLSLSLYRSFSFFSVSLSLLLAVVLCHHSLFLSKVTLVLVFYSMFLLFYAPSSSFAVSVIIYIHYVPICSDPNVNTCMCLPVCISVSVFHGKPPGLP